MHIQKQMNLHRQYVDSFKKDERSLMNSYIHPKTKNTISFMQMMDLINFDSRKRAETIIKKMKFELSKTTKK